MEALCVLDTITANKTVQIQAADERRSKIHGCCVVQLEPDKLLLNSKNPTIYNIIPWLLVRWDKWLGDQASDVPSIILFIISHKLRAFKTLYSYFCNFCKEFTKKLWKKKNNTLGMYLEHQTLGPQFVPANQRIIL